MPPNTVAVTRPGRWGNPFTIAGALEFGYANTKDEARQVVVASFRSWLGKHDQADRDVIKSGSRSYDRQWMLDHLDDIAGRNVACVCGPDQACHGDVLMEFAARQPVIERKEP